MHFLNYTSNIRKAYILKLKKKTLHSKANINNYYAKYIIKKYIRTICKLKKIQWKLVSVDVYS